MKNIDLSTILSEDPINDISQDLLRRGSFVKALSKEIVELPIENSFCFGLYGGWGEGKSSVLNLLRNKLKENPENILLFEFDPWYLATKEAVLFNFLEELGRKLNPRSKKFKKVLKKYFSKLSFGVTVLGTGGHIGWDFGKEGLLDIKKEISSQIETSEKKLVILIDDIDRLESADEILLVFKLVKLIANLKNTIFVLAFDRKAAERTLTNQRVDTDYIDKIVQKPVSLPKIEQTDIDKFLEEALKQLSKNLNVDEQRLNYETETRFPVFYQTYSKRLFTTLRSVKRYINSLYSSLPPVINEVHIFDFMLLEMLKVFAPKVYDDIFENWWFYVQTRSESETDWLNPLHLRFPGKEKEQKDEIRRHIEGLLANEPREIRDILCALFPIVDEVFSAYIHSSYASRNVRQEKRIYSTSFLKYFTLKIPSGELPDALVQGLISSWNETKRQWNETGKEAVLKIKTLENLLKFQQEKNLGELFGKLIIFRESIENDVAPILIKVISQNSKRFSKEGPWRDTESFTAEALVVNLLEEKLNESQIQPILEEVMLRSDSLDFASGVYIHCKQSNKYRPDKKWDVLESIRKTLVNRFTESFVAPQKYFFLSDEPTYVLLRLWDLSSEVEGVSPKECSISKYVWWMLNNNPWYFGRIINGFIPRPIGTKKSSVEDLRLRGDDLNKYFDIERLYKTIKTAYPSVYESEEEKEAVELFCKYYEELKGKAA